MGGYCGMCYYCHGDRILIVFELSQNFTTQHMRKPPSATLLSNGMLYAHGSRINEWSASGSKNTRNILER